jgi:hypothetical protein
MVECIRLFVWYVYKLRYYGNKDVNNTKYDGKFFNLKIHNLKECVIP